MLAGLGLIDTTSWYGADAPKSWHERGRKAIEDGLDSMIAFQQTRWFSDAFRAVFLTVAVFTGLGAYLAFTVSQFSIKSS